MSDPSQPASRTATVLVEDQPEGRCPPTPKGELLKRSQPEYNTQSRSVVLVGEDPQNAGAKSGLGDHFTAIEIK